MITVGIMGLILAMGAPTLYHFFHKEGFRKSVGDMMEACSSARSRAILGQVTTELVFHPATKSCEVSGGPGGGWGGWAVTASFADDVYIEMLDVNLSEYKEADLARVRFFPNGTSDEMTLIIRRGSEWRKISLELTTGLASLEMDPNKWMK
jgi:Tfp pilus assembly protein FimT